MSWRKSWPKLNIYGTNGDGKCSKRQLAPDERSVWDDYLDLAQLSPIRGKVCVAIDIGYTQEQLSKILKTPISIISRAEHNLLKLKMIEIDKNRVIILLNWKKYQSEYNRQLQYRVTSKGNKESVPIDTDTETEPETVTERDIKEQPYWAGFSKETQEKLTAILTEDFNIYAFLGRLNKHSKLKLPEEVIICICNSYLKNKAGIKDKWAWFMRASQECWKDLNAKKNITDSTELNKLSQCKEIKELVNSITKRRKK